MYLFLSTVLFLHLLFLISVFDIYFRSPIINGLEPIKNDVKTPAKRLVLFVGDGLRADYFFGYNNNVTNSPFLRDLINRKEAAWGVSHARVPTESRPGHIALIAGIYEDPSAVFKGWKESLSPFDSIFNQSRTTFAWGSPDVVPLFSRGSKGHIYYDCYTPAEEDLSGKNKSSHKLNLWVYNKFQNLFKKSSRNDTLLHLLKQDKIIFFLHLLGIDVAGHASKPNSKEYIENIQITDYIVSKTTRFIADYYKDNATAFIFTSDHGMTDWGSHGAGSKSETETPFLAWGSGVKKPHCLSYNYLYTDPSWKLPSYCRQDLQQADVAVLMASLLGIAIPTNSMGTLPIRYLDFDSKSLVSIYQLNALQLLRHFNTQEKLIMSSLLPIFFYEFKQLSMDNQNIFLKKIEYMKETNSYIHAISMVDDLVKLAHEGIKYYETYYQYYLLTSVGLTYLGLMVFILSELIHYGHKSARRSQIKKLDVFFASVLIGVFVLFMIQSLPVKFLIYSIVPIILWWKASQKLFVRKIFRFLSYSNLVNITAYIIGIEIMWLSFHERRMLSVAMLALSLWPISNSRFYIVPTIFKWSWTISCLALSVFPLLPTVGTAMRIDLVLLCGYIWLFVGMSLLVDFPLKIDNINKPLLTIQVLMIIPIVWNIDSVSDSFARGEGLLTINQCISVLISILYCCIIMVGPVSLLPNFINVCFSLGVPFLLFSTAHESFFPLILIINLSSWIIIEYRLYHKHIQSKRRKVVNHDDFRKAFFFIFYIIFSFFGIGNIDSINSFDTNWVRCFITVFSPFIMTTLILMKTVIPFLLVSCAFNIVTVITEAKIKYLMLIALLFCELIGLQLLFMVKNNGSWLEIGKSISHYVIMEVMVLVLVLLLQIANLIVGPLRAKALPKWHKE